MYAFLSKVFGRKKDDRDASASSSSQPVLGPGELLGGRFEAVSANVSPSSQVLELDPNINEVKDKDKEKERNKDVGFSFFKGKWRPASPDVKPTRKLDMLPHLSLNFQEPKAEPATPNLGLLFTTDQILSDADIGQRRLNPSEALILVQACSRAIVARGLETLGIMHPHWYAASHKIQRRVISHFIYLLNLENATSSPSLASPISAFEGEVDDTFSPHDIAAILRWGLRHVQIEGNSFGTDDGWYKTFLESEGAAGYPPKAFSDKLAPLLPTAHLQLLTATLEIFSSLAAHAEVNGTSGSKLCKLFGLWLLTAHRVDDKDDWNTFYARWERTGRMLEHLFLSRIRDQSTDQRMPIRLLELIHKYPYNHDLPSPTTDLSLLPHPPFTTRLHDALFVRIEIELPYGKRKPSSKLHPLSLLADAFSTKVEGEYADLWAKITTASKDGDSSFPTNIFTDDTVNFLSFVPDEPSGHEVKSPTFHLTSSVSPNNDADKSAAFVPGHRKSASELTPMSPLSPISNSIGSDWAQFSSSGFLEINPIIIPLASTLLDTDIEKTTPPEAVTPLSRKSSKRSKAASPSSPRKSFDLHRPNSPEAKLEGIEEQKSIIKASQPRVIQLDEAFIDFWSDSLLDPISADWPTFIICKFKPSLVPELTFGVAQTIQWLLLEQVYTIRSPPIAPIVVVRPKSPVSPSPSLKNRFSFWSVSRTASSSSAISQKGKKKDQELKVGEMGEVLEEEPRHEGRELTVKAKSPIFRPRRSLDIAPKSTEAKRKSVIIKPAEETKIDEETAAVAAVATGIVVASAAAVVITNELPTAQPSLVGAVTTKVGHSADIPAVEAVAATEAVIPSPEPTVKHDEIPLPTVDPDVVSFEEAKIETEPLESENHVERTAIEPGVIVGEETEGRIEIESSPATQAVPAPITTEAITEVGETVGVLEQQGPIVAPLVSEVAVPEPEIEIEEASARHDDLTSTAEESSAELETSYPIEVTPAAEAKRESIIIKPAEETKIDEETAGIAAVTTGIVVASAAAVVISNELPTAQPSLVEAVTTKVDHSADMPAIEAVAATEAVISSPEPTVKHDEIPLSTVDTDDVFSQEAKVETEPLESENHVAERTAIEPGVIVDEETEGRIEIEPSPATQADPASVAPITTEAITEVGETVGVMEQQGPIVAPLVSEVAVPEPEIEIEEASARHDFTSRAEESPAELETSYPIEVTPAAIDHSLIAEIGSPNDENAVNESETMEPRATEADHTFSPVEEKIDVADGKTSDSAPILAAAQQLPEVASQEILHPQSTAVLVTEDVPDNRENQVEIITSSTKLEGDGTAENIEAKDFVVKEAKHDFDRPSVLPDVINLEPEVETEDTAEPPLSTSFEQGLPSIIEPELDDIAHSDEPAAILNADANGGIERQSEFEQEITSSSKETGVDVVSSSKDALTAVVAHEVETEVEDETHGTKAATTTNDLVAAESPETEHVIPTTEGDSTTHANEAAIVAVGLATATVFSSMDEVVPAGIHEATPEAGNDSEENVTTLEIEQQRKHEVDLTAPETQGTLPDIHSSLLRNDSTPVPLPLEPEIRAERQVEATSTAGVPIDVDVQPDPSASETTPNAQNDIEVQTQVDETSNIKDEPIPESEIVEHIEASDTERPLEDVHASSTRESQNTVQLEPEVDLVAPAEEEPSAITQVAAEDQIESEGATIPIPEDVTASVANVEDQIIVPVEVRSEHAAVVETSSTDELAEVILPPNVEERPELTPLVEPSYKSSDDEIVGSHVVPEVDVHVPETQVIGEATHVSIMAAAPVESDLRRGAAENISVPSKELPVNAEPKEPVTADEIHEVNVPITVETEQEPLSTNSTSEDKALGVEERHVLLSPESREDIELNDDIIPVAAAEPGLEVVAAVAAPVLGTLALQAQHSVEEKTEEVHIVEDASEPEFIAPNEESTVEPVKAQLEIAEAGESDRTDEVEPQIIPAISEEIPAQIEEDRPVLAEDDTTLSKAVHAEPLDTELVPIEQSAMVVESEPDALHMDTNIPVVPTPAIDVDIAVTAQVHEDRLDTTVIPEAESDLPSHEIKTEIIKEGDAVQDSSPSKSFVDVEVQPEAQVLEETFNIDTADPSVAAVNILPEALPSTQGPIVAPLVSEVAIPEPEIEIEAPPKHDLTSTAEESLAVSTSEPETPAAIDHILLAESGSSDDVVNEAKFDFAPSVTVLPDVNNLESEVETEATVEPPLPTSIEQGLPELDTDHSVEPAAIAEGSSKVADATGGIELQSDLEQETLTVLSPSAQQTGVDNVSSGDDAIAATTTNDLAAAEFPEMEQPVMPATEGDSTIHVDEAAIVAVGLATAAVFSNIDEVVPEDIHEAAPEAGNDSVESGTTLDIEPQREHEVDATAPETEGTLPDIHTSLHNDPAPVPLPLEPEISLIKTESAAECQVETTSTATTIGVLVDVEIQPDPSLSETVPDAQKDIEVQTQVDDTSNKPIPESDVAQHTEAADTESPLEDVPGSNTNLSQNTVQLEPEVDFVAPAEEEPSAVTQVAAEDQIESEGATIPIPEDVTVSVGNVEDQIIAPVDVRPEHTAVVETSTDELAEVILPPNVEERPETLTPLVEPSYTVSDDEMKGNHVVPEVDVHVPETQVFGEAVLMAAVPVESNLERRAAENILVPSQELPVNAEPEEPVSHEEADGIPEVKVPISVETEPEPLSTNSASEDKALEVEERHVLLSPESREAADIELNDDIIPLAAAEPGPEVVAAVAAPVLGTFELQAQHSVEETTEEVHIVEAASEPELIIPNEESIVEPVKTQLEIPEVGESDTIAEVEPQIIPAINEEIPAQIEEDSPVLSSLQDDTTLSKAVHAVPLDTELVPMCKTSGSDSTTIADSSKVVSIPAIDVDIAVVGQAPEVQEDRLDTTVIPEAESDLPSHEIKTEGSELIKEGDAVQDSSPSSKSYVDIEAQPEAQVLEEPFNIDKADSGVVAVNILPEALPSTQGPIVAPLVSEVAIPEPEIEIGAPPKHDHLTSTAEESVAVSTSEPETPAAIDHILLAESGSSDEVVNEAKFDFAPGPVLPDVNNLESEVETETTVGPPLPTSIEHDLHTTIEPELDTAHPDEPAAIVENSPKTVLNAELEKETLTVSSPSTQETGVDVVSSSMEVLTADVAHGVGTEVKAETHGTDAATATNDLAAVGFPETEQPIMPTTNGDSTKHVNEAATVAVGLATAAVFSSMDEVVPEGIHEATPEAGNDSVESGTNLVIEPQQEHEVDVTAPETEGTLPDIHTSLHNDPTPGPVPLPLEPEISLIKTELVDQCQVETTSTATTIRVPVEVEVQPDPNLSETVPDTQKDIEVQTQVDETSNKPIPESDVAQHIEAADTESALEDVPGSNTNPSQNTVQLELEVDFVAPAEEEPSAITQVAVEDQIDSEGATIPIPEDVTAPVANVEDQIIAPVDARSEHAVVETSSTDEPAEVILPPIIEERPETSTPLVEPSYKSPDDEIVGSHVVPEVDVHVPETQVIGEAALVSIMAAAPVESDLGRGAAENISVPSQELPVNAELEEPVTHEEADEIPEVNVPITVETEPKALEVEERHVLLSPESRENIKSNDDIVPLAAAEPGPEETMEQVHIVEAASEPEFPNEESTVEPVIAQLEIPEVGESDRTAEVELQIIPAFVEEIPAQIEEDTPVLAEDDTTLSKAVHAEPLDTELDFVALAEEEPTDITQVAAEDLLPKIEAPGETIPIPENATASVANVEAPVDAQSEHAAGVETSCTNELAEVILPPDVEESPETLTPLVEPSYKVSDDELMGSHVVPEVDVHVHMPESQTFAGAALVSIMAAAPVESVLGLGTAENISVPSQELPVNAEPEEPVTREEATPEVNVPFTVETEPETLSTNSTSEDKALEVEEQHLLLSPESRDAANIELKDDIIPLAAAEPEPEVVAPVLGTFELQAQHSMEESAEEVHVVEAASETEFIVPNEESIVGPVEVPGTVESDRTAEVEPQTIPAIVEESPAQIEEDRPVLEENDNTLSKAVHAEPLDTELVAMEDPAMVMESELDSLHMDTSIPVVPTPAIAVTPQAPQVQEDRLDTSVILEAESDQPSHEIKTEDDTNNLLISTSSTAIAGEFIGEIPVVTNVIFDESAVSAPLNEETPLQQFRASVDSQDADAIVIEDTQDVIPSHDPTAEGNDILESTTEPAEEGALTDTSVNAAIPASVEESIDRNLEHIASGDISKTESELPLSDGEDTSPVDNPQDNISITTTAPAHVDEMPLEDVKDKDDVAAEPSVMSVDEFSTNVGGASETIEHSYPLDSALDAHIDAEHIGERTEGQAILETTAVDDLVVDQAALGKVEMQSFDETEAPETHDLNANGHSTTTQETIGTHASSVNLATDEDNIQADPKVIEPIEPSHISPATLEAPSISID